MEKDETCCTGRIVDASLGYDRRTLGVLRVRCDDVGDDVGAN